MINAMTRAEIWLQDTLDKPLGIEDLANHIGYSASQVRRQFRRYFNLSPREYRETRRLERAAVLLALTSQNIAQIATQCGYLNHSSFSRAFLRHYHQTPRECRLSLNQSLPLTAPMNTFQTSIEHSLSQQALLMRLYKSPSDIQGLGNIERHAGSLCHCKPQLKTATPTISLPDLLAEKIAPQQPGAKPYQIRTDLGLYLNSKESAASLALPVTHRRVDMPSYYYARTYFKRFSEFSQAIAATLLRVTQYENDFQISGEAPRVLWHSDCVELRIPVSPVVA